MRIFVDVPDEYFQQIKGRIEDDLHTYYGIDVVCKDGSVKITIQFWVDNVLVCQQAYPEGMPIPQKGDTVNFGEGKFGIVTGSVYYRDGHIIIMVAK